MPNPLANRRARMRDRADEHDVRRIGRAAHAEVHLLAGSIEVTDGVPLEPRRADGEHLPAYPQDRWLAANWDLLRSAQAHMDQAFVLLADLQNALVTTMKAIRTSRELIVASDRVIARAQSLGCDDPL